MTVEELARKLARADDLVRGVAAGYGAGLLVLGLGDVTALTLRSAPRWLVALFITLMLAAGYLIAQAWSALRYARHLAEGAPAGEEVPAATRRPRRAADRESPALRMDMLAREWRRFNAYWRWALAAVAAAALVLLAAIWAGAAS